MSMIIPDGKYCYEVENVDSNDQEQINTCPYFYCTEDGYGCSYLRIERKGDKDLSQYKMCDVNTYDLLDRFEYKNNNGDDNDE